MESAKRSEKTLDARNKQLEARIEQLEKELEKSGTAVPESDGIQLK